MSFTMKPNRPGGLDREMAKWAQRPQDSNLWRFYPPRSSGPCTRYSATFDESFSDSLQRKLCTGFQALRQPTLNMQIAKAYLAGTDNVVNTKTWQHAIDMLTNTKPGASELPQRPTIIEPGERIWPRRKAAK